MILSVQMVATAERSPEQGFLHERREPHLVYPNLSRDQLLQHAAIYGEGVLLPNGPLVIDTGEFTSRRVDDNFFVSDGNDDLWFEGGAKPLDREHARILEQDVMDHLDSSRRVYMQDVHAVADPRHRMRIRLNTTSASAAVFAENQFFRNGTSEDYDPRSPDIVVYHAPGFQVDAERHGTRERSSVAITHDFERGVVVIAGTRYLGQTYKGPFTIMMSALFNEGLLPLHGSVSEGPRDVSLFLALSGTGKTTLSNAPGRALVNDDLDIWTDTGMSGGVDGVYAKTIRLDPQKEERIYKGAIKHGTLLENVIVRDGELDFNSKEKTENTRASISNEDMEGVSPTRMTGHPDHVFFLSFDAYGVLPPVSELTHEQAEYWFLSGYTSKVGGTVAGVEGVETTLSAAFGQEFLPYHPIHYSQRFSEKIRKHRPKLWLVNTGNDGTGRRMPIAYTRAIIEAAQQGLLEGVSYGLDNVMNLRFIASCPGVPPEVLNPASSWGNQGEFMKKRRELASMIQGNMRNRFAGLVTRDVFNSGPIAS